MPLYYPFDKYKPHDEIGRAQVKKFRQGDYIRLVDKNGKVGKKTYVRGAYDREQKKYHLVDTNDVWGNGRYVKGNIMATDDFEY